MNMKLLALAMAVVLTGCGDKEGYQFGDATRAVGDMAEKYCASTDPAFRQSLRDLAANAGVEIPLDVCKTYGLVDALVGTPEQAQ